MHLVDQQQFAVGGEPELVLRVGEDQSAALAAGAAAFEQGQGHGLHAIPQLRIDEAALGDIGTRQRHVVATVVGLGGGGDDRRVEARVLGETVGQFVAVHHPRAGRVLRPQCGVGDAGDVPPHDHLDRERHGAAGDQHVRIGNRHEVVGDDVTGLLEPPRRELVEHLTLVGHAGDDAVEGGQPIGRDEQPVPVRAASTTRGPCRRADRRAGGRCR